MLTFYLTLAIVFVIVSIGMYRFIKEGLDNAKENNRKKRELNIKSNFTII